MIPSSWFRRLILAFFLLELAGVLMWLATILFPNPTDKATAQTIAGIVFLFGFYAGAPLSARFLAPVGSGDRTMTCRLSLILSQMPPTYPVFLYDHADQNANTVGIMARHSRIYVTSGLMNSMSNDGLKGILAHENAHIREHHIMIAFAYACTYALLVQLTDSTWLFALGLLGFLALRRHFEYRADAGAARLVGKDAVLTGLRELQAIYPSRSWTRWLVAFASHPTLAMRIRALVSGRATA